MYLRRTKKYPPQPSPNGDAPIGGYVPGYLQMVCPICHVPYCGDPKSTRCKRCATQAAKGGKPV
jgi:hypothetical protein